MKLVNKTIFALINNFSLQIPPPIEMLTNVPIPSKDGIKFHTLNIYRASEKENPPGLDLESLPIFAEAYDVNSNFVYVSLYL